MRNKEEMQKILNKLDTKLSDFMDWEPEALELLHRWLESARVWTEEGIVFHDDQNDVDE